MYVTVIESELYTCIHDCMKTFYKGINETGIHLVDLQLLQDKNWMKNKVLLEKGKIAIRYKFFVYCDISIYCDTPISHQNNVVW